MAEKKPRVRPPRKMGEPDRVRERKNLLYRVRNRAYSILAQRHPEEFAEIKNELLLKHGHPPTEESYATRVPVVSMDDPL